MVKHLGHRRRIVRRLPGHMRRARCGRCRRRSRSATGCGLGRWYCGRCVVFGRWLVAFFIDCATRWHRIWRRLIAFTSGRSVNRGSGGSAQPRLTLLQIGIAHEGVGVECGLVEQIGRGDDTLNLHLFIHHWQRLHIVLLHERDILAYLEDYAAAVRGQRPPRNANLITGASGTTDIEGSLVLGAHGPAFLHVVIARS